MLTSKIRAEPDIYIMANGHVNCSNDSNNLMTTIPQVQHIPANFPIKNVGGHEYVSVEMPMDYSNPPNHLSHLTDRGCPTIDGCNEFTDHHILTDSAGLPLRNPNYVNHPGVPVDTNGYITNGNMRIPPEGMESTCAIAPQ